MKSKTSASGKRQTLVVKDLATGKNPKGGGTIHSVSQGGGGGEDRLTGKRKIGLQDISITK